MNINPVVIIVAIALYAFVLVYYIINRPKKPIFTGTSIFMLLIFLGFTYIINLGITGNSEDAQNEFVRFMLSILVVNTSESATISERAFESYATIDIVLMVVCFISMILEVKYLFSETEKIKKIKETIKKKEKEIELEKDMENVSKVENEI